MPTVGRLLDRFGVRRVMVVIGLVFAAALCALSAVGSIVGLTAGFVLIRMAGQGALGVTATTAVALWFTRRRGTAMGLVSAVGASAISLAPVLLELLVSDWGWRRAWLIEGIAVAVIVLPVAWFAMRDRPADPGAPPAEQWGTPRSVALRTPFFWMITAGIAAVGLLATAVKLPPGQPARRARPVRRGGCRELPRADEWVGTPRQDTGNVSGTSDVVAAGRVARESGSEGAAWVTTCRSAKSPNALNCHCAPSATTKRSAWSCPAPAARAASASTPNRTSNASTSSSG
jgi:hypothetical protein